MSVTKIICKNNHSQIKVLIIVFSVFANNLIYSQVNAQNPSVNPAAAYCVNLGYEYVIKTTEKGDSGYCLLPNQQEVEEWNFIEGKEGKEYSYCSQKGYVPKKVSGQQCNFAPECLVCVLEDGSEIEVSSLLQKDKEEEQKKTMQISVPISNSIPEDSLYNKFFGKEINLFFSILGILVVIALIIVAIIYYIKKRKKLDNNGGDNNIQYTKPTATK